MQTDYAGQTVGIVDPETDEIDEAQTFVTVLGASSYTFATTSLTQRLPDACIGTQGYEENYLDGYIEAAIELADAIIDKELYGKRDTLVLSIMYNARHAVEMTLKFSTDHLIKSCVVRDQGRKLTASSLGVTEAIGKRAHELRGARGNDAAFSKGRFVDGPDVAIVHQFHQRFGSSATIGLHGDIMRDRKPKVILPSVLRERKGIATDDEALTGYCDSGDSEPHDCKILDEAWRGRTSDCHDMGVVIRHLLVVRIVKEVSSDRHVVGIQTVFFAIPIEEGVVIERTQSRVFLRREIRCAYPGAVVEKVAK